MKATNRAESTEKEEGKKTKRDGKRKKWQEGIVTAEEGIGGRFLGKMLGCAHINLCENISTI
jgi:hypothetical protein